MNKLDPRSLVLPALFLGGAALLLAPVRSTEAFTKIGGSLAETQRDVRVFDNFLDATANANTAPHAQFPGYTGAELAVWKGIVEWGSALHGDGTGDGVGTNPLGSGAANFDALWAGNASAVGTSNQNIVSSLPDCSGTGTLAFTETPISDGWRIRFCDEWTWDDGPGSISNRWDIQGVMAHEYGHALGLGHSTTSGTTMFSSGSPGQTSTRSIAPDDVNGVQCVYGVASATKPAIVATVANPGASTLTLHGSQFGATGNEVWFTSGSVTSSSADPVVRVTGASSSGGGTVITVSIPAGAGPGDVIVNKSGTGGATVSNAFPTDLVGTFGTPPGAHPDLVSVTPSTIEALIPGTAKTIQLSGTNLDTTTTVLFDSFLIAATRWTIVGPTRIDLDMPQVPTLGAHTLAVSDGTITDSFPVTIVAPATPRFEFGTGDPGNVVDRDAGLSMRLSGTVGRVHRIYVSLSNLPSTSSSVNLEIGNNFSDLILAGQYTIPAAGWLNVFVPTSQLPDPGPSGVTWYSQTVEIRFPQPFPDSNLQSIFLVR